jgi:tetratricopeptide (TPR) repeat protein
MIVLRLGTLIAAAVLVYANTLGVPFVALDRAAIEGNLRIRALWPGPFAASQPVLEASYALNYALGGLSVRGFHVGNLLLHIACGLLLYDVARRTFILTRTEMERAAPVAWWAALVFLVHPLQTEAVTLASGRAVVLTAFWYLALLELVLVGEMVPRRRILAWGGAVVVAALGMATGPMMATAPLALLWLAVRVLPRPRAPYVGFADDQPDPAPRSPVRWPLYAGVAASAAVLVWLTLVRIDPGAVLRLSMAPLDYLRIQLGVTWHYFRLLVWPVGQTVDYDWPLAGPWMLPALGWVGLLAAVAWLATSGRRAAAFWLGFALLVLLPTSSVVPLADLAVERRAYLTVAGFAVLAALGCAALARRTRRPLVPLAALVVVAALAVTASARNQVWRDPVTLWSDALRQAPTKERIFRRLAASYTRRGDHVRAARVRDAEVFALERALAARPTNPGLRIALSRAYGSQGRVADALVMARGAVKLAPTDPAGRAALGALLLSQAAPHEALAQLEIAQALVTGRGSWIEPATARAVATNLGWAYATVGRSEEGLAVLRQAAANDDVTALNSLGSVLGLLGRWDEARQALERALAKDPHDALVRRNLGWAYTNLGRFGEANALLRRAIVEEPNEPKAHAELGWLRLRAGRPAEALHALSMAAALDPNNAKTHVLLGVARAQLAEWAYAVQAFERAVQLAPNLPLARENLNRARRRVPPLMPQERP